MIKGVLRNERYCGDSILQKTVTVDCIGKVRRKNTGEAPMYYVQNSHVGIISRELFHKTQEELARRMSRAPNSTKNGHNSHREILSVCTIQCDDLRRMWESIQARDLDIPREKAGCLAVHQSLGLRTAIL